MAWDMGSFSCKSITHRISLNYLSLSLPSADVYVHTGNPTSGPISSAQWNLLEGEIIAYPNGYRGLDPQQSSISTRRIGRLMHISTQIVGGRSKRASFRT